MRCPLCACIHQIHLPRDVAVADAGVLLHPVPLRAAVRRAAGRAHLHLRPDHHSRLGETTARRGGNQPRPADGTLQTEGESI